VVAFSTADVVVIGVRLVGLTDLLREHKLAAVWPLAERYSNLFPDQACRFRDRHPATRQAQWGRRLKGKR